MAHLLTTQPYGQYHASNSKEHMSLRNSAITNFKPSESFALNPKNATDYLNALKDCGKQYCYLGMISRVPTDCDIDAGDANNITFRNRKDLINTFNEVTQAHIDKNATMLWGNKTWAITNDKEIATPSITRGELTAGGQALTPSGKALMLKRFQSEVMGEQALALLDAAGRKAVRVEKSKYEWYNAATGEVINDGLSIAQIILRKLRPNKLITVFQEIAELKKILPGKFGHNIPDWDTAIEEARIEIELKLPSEYSDTAYLNDYFIAALTVPCKSFVHEVTSLKSNWQLGTTMTVEHVRTQICQMYINMEADKTWANELAEVSQIIALTTKVNDLHSKLNDTIALATAAHDSGGSGGGKGGKSGGNPTNKTNRVNGHYTVPDWRLKHDGDSKVGPDGVTTYHWCKDGHWSGGEQVHMYVTHAPGKHAEWRKEIDEKKERRGQFDKESSTPAASETVVNDATKKKLALSEKLRTALTTQAGLSQEAFARIWDESCRDSGNA